MLPKVIIESHIPYVGDSLDGVAEVVRLAPEEITAEAVKDADALVVRTRTRCDARLLDGSKVGMVATATIGTDHIDLDYCRSRGISTASAPGCNAPAVAQYVWSSIFTLRPDLPAGSVIGIVGLGHVGSIVARWGRELGMEILACDPPRQEAEGGYDPENPELSGNEKFSTLQEIARRADVVTFHTPHTREGRFATHHLGDDAFFNSLEKQPIVINAARGPIMATEAILRGVVSRRCSAAVIDCWEGEPAISEALLESSAIATPHIAGYSMEGKQRATGMSLREVLDYIAGKYPELREKALQRMSQLHIPPRFREGMTVSRQAIVNSYDPMTDTAALRAHPEAFEALRNGYDYRHEV